MDSSPRTKAHDRPASASASGDRDTSTSTTKRPASQPQLLPPLELLSSSPGLPGLPNAPPRRQSRPVSAPKAPSGASNNDYLKYPTPVPTSSTGILSSSPPRVHAHPPPQRAPSIVSERAPLSAVPSVELNENGDTLRMGRSSNSSDYQLSANRLISRVHVKARYVPATVPLQPNKIEIECNGWNGLKLHCQGRTYDMHKGEVLSFETEGVEIMLNVQDARVLVHWPKRDARDGLADLGWEDSPPRSHSSILSDLPSISEREKSVEIYEDEDADEDGVAAKAGLTGDQSFMTDANNSFSSDLSDANSDGEDENYPNEENDPIVHSFGPFGANLNSRMAMTSFHVDSPKRHGNRHEAPVQAEKEKELQPDVSHLDVAAITNHVVNQLAFSRLSSTPLSTIMANLPAEEKEDLLRHHLRFIVETATCIGTIEREGKDADGKPLESQYYYIPEKDDDEHRRAAVVDGLRKPTLRNCRKHHVQYYWKRPRTP
ncbi:putative transcription factor tos4 [Diaporthe ampelina]|uniref:Putative transcription factor tos4 n=1 Tax=Diaporthe ampelina TaxID=1214573 RepID=A0A0G2HTW7_9PEZI|nr:putative transcription factor tos4 [Diaporthe ampelina]